LIAITSLWAIGASIATASENMGATTRAQLPPLAYYYNNSDDTDDGKNSNRTHSSNEKDKPQQQ